MSDDTSTPRLIELARKTFGEILPEFTSAETGILMLNLSSDSIAAPVTTKRAENVVDPRLIEWLATDTQAGACIPRTGLRIRGAVIPGGIDLSYSDIGFPLEFNDCEIQGPIAIAQARIRGLRMIGTKVKGLNGDGCVIDGALELRDRSTSTGPILLGNAFVAGNVDFSDSTIMSEEYALLADGLRVKGDLGLCGGFQAEGQVRLIGAVIEGDLLCTGAQLNNPESIAFNADRAWIGGVANFGQEFTAAGETRLMGATVKRDLIFEGARLSISNDKTLRRELSALKAEHLDVGGSLRLRYGFSAEGEVSLSRSMISKSFDCSKGTFNNPDGIAINADGIDVHDVYFTNGFEAHGQVRVLGARVSGDLACVRGTFNGCIDTTTDSPGKVALAADGARIEGSVYLRHLKAHGGVRLTGTRIGLNLECDAADIANPDGIALNAQGAEIGGNALFRERFHAMGDVCLHGTSVKRYLIWDDIENPGDAVLDLQEASVGILRDHTASWPREGNLKLRGFRCKQLSGSAPNTARERIRWVNLQPRSERQSQTYEWLARSLRESGDHHGANELLIEKNNEILTSGSASRRTKVGLWFRRTFTGYGYQPWRILIWALPLFLGSYFLFSAAAHKGLFVPAVGLSGASIVLDTHRSDDPDFRPFWYTVDSFVPFVDVDQIEGWTVDLDASGNLLGLIRMTGTFVNDFRHAIQLIGWFLVAYFASSGVAAIARKL